LKAGTDVDVLIVRAGKEEKVVMPLTAWPAGFTDELLGLALSGAESKTGLLVTDVVAGGPSARAGLQKGDRIAAIAGEPIGDRNGYLSAVRGLRPGERVMLTVRRGKVVLDRLVSLH